MSTVRQSTEAIRFSRQWWLETARTSFWVVIVTVLIWIYADMEFTQTDDIAMRIRLNTEGSKDAVMTSPAVSEVTFQIRGSRSDLDRFVKKFRGVILQFDLSTVEGFGEDLEAIPSALVLQSLPEINELGLRVVSGNPATIKGIRIEKLETRELPIEFVFKGAELAETPKGVAKVRAPESVWSRIPPNPVIRTVEKNLNSLTAGQKQDVTFQLISAIGAEAVKLIENEVTVNLEVVRRATAATETIPVTVRIVTPAEWSEKGVWAEYKLVRKDRIEWRPKITVTGPRKDIDILKTDKTKTVDAYIVLTDSDTDPIDSWSSRPVTLRFPSDLQIRLAPGQTEPSVQFRLEKRATTVTP